MDFLARREHTTKEIFIKLENRVESIDILSAEIKKLEEEGLLDNQRFAEQYIHSRSTKGYGPLRIKQELKQRGVNENISQPILNNIDWTSLAIGVLKKKVKHEFPKETKPVLKLKKFLNYRGFDFSQIEQAFSSYKKT
jgi:regulatory protein